MGDFREIFFNGNKENVIISQFRGEHYFLSNFCYSPFKYDNVLYPSVEHFFQCHKTLDMSQRSVIAEAENPSIAKKYGRMCNLRPDWDDIKDEIMRLGVFNKFTILSPFKKKLLETNEAILIEGNTWNDTYWGMDLNRKKGENKLGIILMELRTLIRNNPSCTFLEFSINEIPIEY